MNTKTENERNKKTSLTVWLALSCILIVLIILIGGLTRLTNSGLSIVEWQPITGIIPPLNELDWQTAFAKYKTSPEYDQYNFNISLSEFKFIFWLEFIHRFIGRIGGLLYISPLLYFYAKGQIRQDSVLAYFLALSLFIAQGFMGWYMVKSGLVDKPYISHYRLACHLIIAVIIYSLLWWQLMKNSFDILIISSKTNLNSLKFLCLIAIIMLYWQIFVGGLVAGLDAGHVYNSFPLMGSKLVPLEINLSSISLQSFNDAVFVQFIHRINSYLITVIIFMLILTLLRRTHPKLNKVATFTFLALLTQMSAGIFTILYDVPVVIALIHQFFAIVLLSILLWCYFLLKNA